MNAYLASVATLAAYLLSGLLLAVRLRRRSQDRKQPRWPALAVGGMGLASHTWALSMTVFAGRTISLGLFNAASLLGWVVVVLLLVTSLRRSVENLGILLLPLAGLAVVASVALPDTQTTMAPRTWHVDAHIVLSLLAFGLILLAVAQALLLSVQERALRRHRPGGFVRALPPLETMEELLFQLITVGFFLLSLALLSGLLFIESLFAQHLVHKTVLSIAAWVVFGVLLWGHWRHGWRGRLAVRWTVGGGVALTLAYFGSKFVLELLLQTSWG